MGTQSTWGNEIEIEKYQQYKNIMLPLSAKCQLTR